jgi:hypothetical protein
MGWEAAEQGAKKMRTSRLAFLPAALALLAAPQVAGADPGVEEQLRAMQQRMEQLETRLDATTDELEAANRRVEQQSQLIEQSGLADANGTASGVASFLESLEIGGWVAGSYWWNFEDPNGESLASANQGITGFAYPFHGDHNSFQVDQLWFELERPVSEDARAGFRADIFFGKTADVLGDSSGTIDDGSSLDETDMEVYQAYAQYLAPIGDGVTFKFGKFATYVGAEVAPTVYNLNVTRGNVYNLLQPINLVGLLAEAKFGEYVDVGVGVVNEVVSDVDIDLNNDKAATWHLGVGSDTLSFSFNGMYGSSDGVVAGRFGDGALEADKDIIYDAILRWDPFDWFTWYANGTYREVETDQLAGGPFAPDDDFTAWGVATAGRFAITDKLGFALRGEVLIDKDSFFTGLGFPGAVTPAGYLSETQLWSLTGTVDYALTDQLKVRTELRYDLARSDDGEEDVFIGDDAEDPQDDQLVAGVEVIYSF